MRYIALTALALVAGCDVPTQSSNESVQRESARPDDSPRPDDSLRAARRDLGPCDAAIGSMAVRVEAGQMVEAYGLAERASRECPSASFAIRAGAAIEPCAIQAEIGGQLAEAVKASLDDGSTGNLYRAREMGGLYRRAKEECDRATTMP